MISHGSFVLHIQPQSRPWHECHTSPTVSMLLQEYDGIAICIFIVPHADAPLLAFLCLATVGMLHLYETLGFWRRSTDMKRIHFAEELNEYRHLLIMESLGGDQAWWVRFVAQHSAMVYFVVLCMLFAISPSLSYQFSEMLENHAVITYTVFCENNKELLKDLPPSKAAAEYYSLGSSDVFYAEFQTAACASGKELRRPGEYMRSLYDVFRAIAEDEGDHVQTMNACLDPQANLQSPSRERGIVTTIALTAAAAYLATTATFIDPAILDPSLLDSSTLADMMGAADGATLAEVIAAGAVRVLNSLLSRSGFANIFSLVFLLVMYQSCCFHQAAFGRMAMEDDARSAASLGLDALEGGGEMLPVLEQLRRFAVQIIELFGRFL